VTELPESLAGIEASHKSEIDGLHKLTWEVVMAKDESIFHLELQAAQADLMNFLH
jgi:hypothetical protein